ncbi:beta-ketoacyl synthase N-terminal-like domain-containing protein [Nostoc sp. NMS4]|uniref:beta-ketoacyl synthase N-terminal-like domain-containing protein n=1 Tax=Nostoc sp. NMS4 TaxID=2815390 RepID=UPI0025E1BB1E|nr:beta-ketoacyl synthase N-terminal-like domain-containing protein [Nostoc sp. NMS4]MBN3927936.1 acyltransferase domain-containing protein [Nostoc sp. NMS4]
MPDSINKVNSRLQQTPVAIIGMACIFPQARNLQEYWGNIISKVDCITDIPLSRWNIDDYYDPDPKTPDKTYCKRGGFIPDIDFNPMEFGLPPNILEVTDSSQILSLLVAKQAMVDAGYGEASNTIRNGTGVILGVGGGQKLITPLTTRLQYPVWEKVLRSSGLSEEETHKIVEKIKLAYIKWEENSFPGMLGNVIAGRIANRLDLGGINCVVDAACAASLGALRMALSELTEYRSEMMITGGVDTDNSIFMYMSFSKTPAFSKQQKIRPFDAESDGMLIGEGIGMMVLKRLEDAERDGDRVYAVIKGIGTSSDGKHKSIYAPRSSGQAVALRRAYTEAGFTASTVSLIEAHGTGTMAGDPAEFAALNEVFSENNPKKQHVALGSVKSQIGHTKATAGAASLIKTALALHHKILPPTINITKPHPQLKIEDTPFYLNTETRPWHRTENEPFRRAGVSSFGFGGTNYHVVLEEYQNEQKRSDRLHHNRHEILLFADNQTQLQTRCESVLQQLQSPTKEQHYAELVNACKTLAVPHKSARLGFIAESVTEICECLEIAINLLINQVSVESWEHPQGIYYRQTGIDPQAKIVALFSGQGSQYLEMGKELTYNFPILRQTYAQMDSILLKDGLSPISDLVFPTPVFAQAQKDAQVATLQRTENAQAAIGVLSVGLYKILQQTGFKPDFVAGHSFGELTALWCAGVLQDEDYFFLTKARGQVMASVQHSDVDTGGMLAVTGDITKLPKLIIPFPQITIANWNSNSQVVLAGTKSEISKVQQVLDKEGYSCILLTVSAAFHTSLVSYAQKPFAQAIKTVKFNQPQIPVFSNLTGNVYPQNPEQIRQTLVDHLLNPVLFKQEIENIYANGGYCFVEFGPKQVLTNLVKNILGKKPHLAIALNPHSRHQSKDSDRTFREAVVQLRVTGLALGELDPYQVEQKVPEPNPKKSLTVRLNGGNYVSEKTRNDFEKALQSGDQIKSSIQPKQEPPKLEPKISGQSSESGDHIKSSIQPKQDAPKSEPKISGQSSGGNGNGNGNGRSINGKHPKTPENGQTTTDKSPKPSQTPSLTSKSNKTMLTQSTSSKVFQQLPVAPLQDPFIIESFERMSMRYYEHQAEVLRVQEQYLKNQGEASEKFLQMMQQQYSVLIAEDTNFHQKQLTDFPAYSSSKEPEITNKSNIDTTAIASPKLDVAPTQINVSESIPEKISNPIQPIISTKIESQEVAISFQSPAIDLTFLSQSLLSVVSEKTGYPTEMLELKMDLEADLGIDSIKRVEILAAMQELSADLPSLNPEELSELRTLGEIVEYMGNRSSIPVTIEKEFVTQLEKVKSVAQETSFIAPLGLEVLAQSLLEIVSDKTGYPTEMLELKMDLEADLGIDSIKRVEILAAMQELSADLPSLNPEELSELRTLGEIVEYIGQQSLTAEKKTLIKI